MHGSIKKPGGPSAVQTPGGGQFESGVRSHAPGGNFVAHVPGGAAKTPGGDVESPGGEQTPPFPSADCKPGGAPPSQARPGGAPSNATCAPGEDVPSSASMGN